VVLVNHRRALGQLGQVVDQAFGIPRAPGPLAALGHALGEELRLADDGQACVRQPQAFIERGGGDQEGLVAGEDIRPALDRVEAQPVTAQQVAQRLAAAGGLGGDQQLAVKMGDEAAQ